MTRTIYRISRSVPETLQVSEDPRMVWRLGNISSAYGREERCLGLPSIVGSALTSRLQPAVEGLTLYVYVFVTASNCNAQEIESVFSVFTAAGPGGGH